jgi:hypothetical protein
MLLSLSLYVVSLLASLRFVVYRHEAERRLRRLCCAERSVVVPYFAFALTAIVMLYSLLHLSGKWHVPGQAARPAGWREQHLSSVFSCGIGLCALVG